MVEAAIPLQNFRIPLWGSRDFTAAMEKTVLGQTLHPLFAALQVAMARRKLQPVQKRPEGSCSVLEKIPGRSCGPWKGACAGGLCEDSNQWEGHTLEQGKA